MKRYAKSLVLNNHLIRRWRVKKRYRNEISFLRGNITARSTTQSFIFFSVHRAASSYLGGLLKQLAVQSDLIPIDLDGYFFDIGQGRSWEGGNRDLVEVEYPSRGYYFGPFRSYNAQISSLEDFKILLVLRDPRDVLVSAYYSIFSHALPVSCSFKEAKERSARKAQRLQQSVDDFVVGKLESGSELLRRYRAYHEKLYGKSHVLFLKYEDLIEDFNPAFDRIVQFLGLDINRQFISKLKAELDFTVPKENIFKHKRQVKPGDHRRKLKKDTIRFLNSETKEVLKLFDYPL